MNISIHEACEKAKIILQDGPLSSEQITDRLKESGVNPTDDRYFGVVIAKLSRDGFIYKYGTCLRRKGHNTTGGNIWAMRS